MNNTDWVSILVGIIGTVVAVIMGLFYRNRSLSQQNAALEAQQKSTKAAFQTEEDIDDANAKELEYKRTRDAFLNSDDDGSTEH